MVENVTSCLEFRIVRCGFKATDRVTFALYHGLLNTKYGFIMGFTPKNCFTNIFLFALLLHNVLHMCALC